MLRDRPRTLGLVVLCFAFLGTACARAPQSGVNLRALTADLVFGIPPVAEPAAPPNLDPLSDAPPVRGSGSERIFGGNAPFTPRPPVDECPEAAPDAFPEEPASTDVPVQPKAGDYQWAVDGKLKLASGDLYSLSPFTSRTIDQVEERAFGHSFVTTEREFGGATAVEVIQTWEVRTQPPANSLVPDDRGIYLTQIERKQGSERTTFRPSPRTLYLKLPVTPGEMNPSSPTTPHGEMDTFSSDENGSGATLRHTGTVTHQVDVDACGTKIRGWFVNATQEFVSPNPQEPARPNVITKNFDYVIATQMGGFIVMETVEVPDNSDPEGEPRLRYQARLGQVEPSTAQ